MKKTLEQYEAIDLIKEENAAERSISDRLYAEKRIERIVDGFLKFAYTVLAASSIALITYLVHTFAEYYKNHS